MIKDKNIGRKFNGGKLTVVSRAGKRRSTVLYFVHCDICSKDKELFPDGFISTIGNLNQGKITCGCGRSYCWNETQYLIRAKRSVVGRNIKVHGIHGKFDGYKTRILCECLLDGFIWTPTVNELVNGKKAGCQRCAKNERITEQDALTRCRELCVKYNYEPIGFLNGYKNIHSIFSYNCPQHGVHSVVYRNFIKVNCRCPKCAGVYKPTEQEAFDNCKIVCEGRGYTPLGFPYGYKNSRSIFEYHCPKHGKVAVTYTALVHKNSECKMCYKDDMKTSGRWYGWFPKRAEESDNLYLLNFDNKYIKIGRTFNFKQRYSKLKSVSKCENLTVLRLFKATHSVVFKLEQEILTECRINGLKYNPTTWKCGETLKSEALLLVLSRLDDNKEIEDMLKKGE